MKILTHITISIILYEHLGRLMKLDKVSFIYGNIKPDLSYKQLQKAHIMENHFSNICEKTNELMHKEMSVQKFSVELGQICHYISDFFCRYHFDKEMFHKYYGHFFYEYKLELLLWKLMSKNQLNSMINKNKEKKKRKNIASILLEMRSNYIDESSTSEKDLIYAISTALWVGESVGYYLAQTDESVGAYEIETYANTASCSR